MSWDWVKRTHSESPKVTEVTGIVLPLMSDNRSLHFDEQVSVGMKYPIREASHSIGMNSGP